VREGERGALETQAGYIILRLYELRARYAITRKG
jgi:hypothetical protein